MLIKATLLIKHTYTCEQCHVYLENGAETVVLNTPTDSDIRMAVLATEHSLEYLPHGWQVRINSNNKPYFICEACSKAFNAIVAKPLTVAVEACDFLCRTIHPSYLKHYTEQAVIERLSIIGFNHCLAKDVYTLLQERLSPLHNDTTAITMLGSAQATMDFLNANTDKSLIVEVYGKGTLERLHSTCFLHRMTRHKDTYDHMPNLAYRVYTDTNGRNIPCLLCRNPLPNGEKK